MTDQQTTQLQMLSLSLLLSLANEQKAVRAQAGLDFIFTLWETDQRDKAAVIWRAIKPLLVA